MGPRRTFVGRGNGERPPVTGRLCPCGGVCLEGRGREEREEPERGHLRWLPKWQRGRLPPSQWPALRVFRPPTARKQMHGVAVQRQGPSPRSLGAPRRAPGGFGEGWG